MQQFNEFSFLVPKIRSIYFYKTIQTKTTFFVTNSKNSDFSTETKRLNILL